MGTLPGRLVGALCTHTDELVATPYPTHYTHFAAFLPTFVRDWIYLWFRWYVPTPRPACMTQPQLAFNKGD